MLRVAEFLRSRRTPCAERDDVVYLERFALDSSALYSRFSFEACSFSSFFSRRLRSSASTVFGLPFETFGDCIVPFGWKPFMEIARFAPCPLVQFELFTVLFDLDRVMARTWGGGRW